MLEENGKAKCEPLDGRDTFYANLNDPVSMNLFCFKADMIDYLDTHIKDYFLKQEDLNTCEYLIPDAVFERIDNGEIKMRVIDTNAVWHGITYKEDKEELVNCIQELINSGEYPNNLYK